MSAQGPPSPQVLEALTDLLAYALALDGEREQALTALEEQRRVGTDRPRVAALAELLSELTTQLDVLRQTIDALRRHEDPTGAFL